MQALNKTIEKAMTIDQMIEHLTKSRESLGGNAEVVLVNKDEACFDGVGTMFEFHVASTGEKALAIMRGNVVLKP